MAETQVHAELMIDLHFALRNFFRDDPQTYVCVNMLSKKRNAPSRQLQPLPL